ncbi:MAG: YbdK family carboxylate-amine ligase [Candidatus Electrothrix aestuarii]|uniref:Putative glutamate--cysteine ligase 2 n=1 Tax=Candidatus Electrothrix aestuarii TaxID=3062594 RepID=A0AAU8LT61_9BACT|nr:YbdK family carboxylate-amine ligase [Candidatus Electrothrix aestuarii]
MQEIPFSPVFHGSQAYTLGVELEFQLVDRETLDLVPRVSNILQELAPDGSNRIVPEFLQSIVELQTGVCDSVNDVGEDLSRLIHLVEDAASHEKCYLYSTSLHPFADPSAQVVSQGERYQRIMNELQHVGRQFITQGMHVHVGIPDGNTAIKVCDTIQPYLPILLALSCSSPFFCGRDTGFQSYRTKLFEALPIAGISGYLGTWQSYVQEVTHLYEHRAIERLKDLWWDVRPSPKFGTVEVRICDLPCRFYSILGLTATIQALAAYLAEADISSCPVSLQILRCNKWQASRHALEGRFIDPCGLLSKTDLTMREAASRLFQLILPMTERFQTTVHVRELCKILESGTGADRQRRLAEGQKNNFRKMITSLRNDYWLKEQ